MTYKTTVTSKGTTTIPLEIRKQLGIKPGMQIMFTKTKSGEYTIARSRTIEEVRALNKQALTRAATDHKEYKSGDGFALASLEKFGK
jgi:AbrB family looped-hinge helix DNA binding protein